MPDVSQKLGFTLIELLITIALVGILSGIIAINFGNGQKLARDAQRKSDLAQYHTALEAYANANNNLYPAFYGKATDLCTSTLTAYTSSCPDDPQASTGRYYAYNSGTGSSYFMFINSGLEINTLGLSDGTTWVVCSSGKVGPVENSWPPVSTYCP